MSIITVKTATAVCLFATIATIGLDASAATIKVTCELRSGRSKISIDAADLPSGKYSTIAVSGGHSAKSPIQTAVSGEIETDFDSNPADIAAGATAITATFITGGSVTGKVVDARGNTVLSDTEACRVKTK